MKYIHIITILFFIISCGQNNNNNTLVKNDINSSDDISQTKEHISLNVKLTDKTVKFLWCAPKYDEEFKETFYSIFIDEEFCKTITDAERAALGYVATFIGNECWWDGDRSNDDRSNLKCKILTALNLGYQCSDRHLGFLRYWFREDKNTLTELEHCPQIPYTATIQDTFDEIVLTVKGNKVSVFFKAYGINTSEGKRWSWTETNYFEVHNDNIKLIKKDISKIKEETF